jgi:hypothetical protein
MFKEGPILFTPTYKLKKFLDEYAVPDRIPGWTDRILYYSKIEENLH